MCRWSVEHGESNDAIGTQGLQQTTMLSWATLSTRAQKIKGLNFCASQFVTEDEVRTMCPKFAISLAFSVVCSVMQRDAWESRGWMAGEKYSVSPCAPYMGPLEGSSGKVILGLWSAPVCEQDVA